MAMDQLSDQTRKDLEGLAAQHDTFASFLQDVQRYADKAWHDMRGKQPTKMQPHEHVTGTQPAETGIGLTVQDVNPDETTDSGADTDAPPPQRGSGVRRSRQNSKGDDA